MKIDPKKRFSDRVAFYVKYRPSYPVEIIKFMETEMGLTRSSTIADIGSGTGLLAEVFLKNGNHVYGIEPNGEMRHAAGDLLQAYPHFRSLPGSAEKIPLASHSMNFIVAGQAFHWFEREKARKEFARILKPGGWVVLFWNTRKTAANVFMQKYEELLTLYSTDYQQVNHKNIDSKILSAFFGEGGFREKFFPNYQQFDYESLTGRLLSSSYAPLPGHPLHEPLISGLEKIFREHRENGKVKFIYDTEMYYGHLDPPEF